MAGCFTPEALRRTRWGLVLGVLLSAMPVSRADPPASFANWKFDVLHHKNGRAFHGLILEETPAEVRFQDVRRKPGRPTVVFTTTFARSEVDRLDRLDGKEREVLAARLKALDPGGAGERQLADALELKPAPWDGKMAGGWCYASDHFVLVSNADEEIIRPAAVRLERLYLAYTRFLPPRQPAAKPTTILLVKSRAEYQAMLRKQGHNLLNPAFYDPQRNQIVCASDLEQLGKDLARLRTLHQQWLKESKDQEAELNRLYKGKVPPQLVQEIYDFRQRMQRAELKNEAFRDAATRQLFQTLYHEAFHAYLGNFVYPPDAAEVPHWLNEGLAQVFETALVEGGELRVGHADPQRLARTRSALRKGELVPLADLLRAGPKQFAVPHASDHQLADRYYLTAWALAFYVTFDRRLLGTARLDDYVRTLKRGSAPLTAFGDLIDGPTLQEFEDGFHRYLRHLRKDGTAGTPPDGK